MEKSIEQLMDERHDAYRAALNADFNTTELTLAWRKANRAYVLAREAQVATRINSKNLRVLVFNNIRKPQRTQTSEVVSTGTAAASRSLVG